jgi:uncharacterized membrane protein
MYYDRVVLIIISVFSEGEFQMVTNHNEALLDKQQTLALIAVMWTGVLGVCLAVVNWVVMPLLKGIVYQAREMNVAWLTSSFLFVALITACVLAYHLQKKIGGKSPPPP